MQIQRMGSAPQRQNVQRQNVQKQNTAFKGPIEFNQAFEHIKNNKNDLAGAFDFVKKLYENAGINLTKRTQSGPGEKFLTINELGSDSGTIFLDEKATRFILSDKIAKQFVNVEKGNTTKLDHKAW